MFSSFVSALRSSQSLPKPLSRHRPGWLKFGLLLLLLLIGGGLGLRLLMAGRPGSQSQQLTQAVQRKTLPVTITANGTVDAARSINLSPKTAGVIEQLLVKEGDRVRRGQVIAIMDDSNLRGQLLQMQGQLNQQKSNLQRLVAGNRQEDIAKAEAQLAEAKANLQQLRSGSRPQEIAQAAARLQQSQATLKLRKTDWQRNQQLFNEGAISREALDQKRTDLDVARNQVQEAEQALALENAGSRPEEIAQAAARVAQQEQSVALLRAGSRAEDIDQARAQVVSARGSLETIKAELQDTKITAPFDGVVIETYADIGAFVSPSMSSSGASASSSSILTLASDRYEVVVNLSEAQIAKVKPGQLVNLKIDALPEASLSGSVAQIAPQATVTQNVTSFEVKVALQPSAAQKLKVGMNVEAEFKVDSLENALLVPNAAVVRQADKEGVYVLGEDRQPVFKGIQTGATANGQTEVKSGLRDNEEVLISPPPSRESDSGGFTFPPRPPE
ncbi:MAG: efflux RND transporter periplasmic adaptor subunit [Cyanobacteria bacterium P01_A01_bin.17]